MVNTRKKGKLTFIDLFAGAGGLSEGFLSNGFSPLAHIEMNPDACATLKTRAAYYSLKANGHISSYNDYLSGKITREQMYQQIPFEELNNTVCCCMGKDNEQTLISHIKKTNGGISIDVVIGGPPCQAYSLVGRARQGESVVNDPRNFLYEIYFDFIKALKPKIFVFENVSGLRTAGGGKYLKDIMSKAKELGYHVTFKTLNSHDYGVLQNRNRVIILGSKNSTNEKAFWSSMETISMQRKNEFKTFIVNDLLLDLPSLKPGGSANEYKTVPSEYLLKSGIRNDMSTPLTFHLTRSIRPDDRHIYRIAIRKWLKGKRLLYTDLPDKYQHHKNKTSFLDRFKVVEGNLNASHTMVAHIAKDGHYFIHPDLKQARSLSVREAARIQSFPDNYYFEGSRTAIFTQIGNAVPPILSDAIAKSVKFALSEEKDIDYGTNSERIL